MHGPFQRQQKFAGEHWHCQRAMCNNVFNLPRQMITFYASESVTKYANIPEEVLTTGTVTNFLLYFWSNGHISSAQWHAKQLELKLVVEEADLVTLKSRSRFESPD